VTGKFGTTTVDRKPVRVVAMSWTDADFALALGVTPVGLAHTDETPAGLQPWTAQALGNTRPVQFNVLGSDPIEQVAKLAPDLILATKDYNLAHSYQQLSQIAPVVTYVNGVNSDTWQQDLANVATALGRTTEATTVTADTEAQIAQQRTDHPELTGKTFSYIIAPTAAGAYTVNSDADVSAKLLDTLGMPVPRRPGPTDVRAARPRAAEHGEPRRARRRRRGGHRLTGRARRAGQEPGVQQPVRGAPGRLRATRLHLVDSARLPVAPEPAVGPHRSTPQTLRRRQTLKVGGWRPYRRTTCRG